MPRSVSKTRVQTAGLTQTYGDGFVAPERESENRIVAKVDRWGRVISCRPAETTEGSFMTFMATSRKYPLPPIEMGVFEGVQTRLDSTGRGLTMLELQQEQKT